MAKTKIAILLHHPQCSLQSAHGLVRTLSDTYGVANIDCVNNTGLTWERLRKYTLLCVPGGIGDSDTWHRICEPSSEAVRRFVRSGRSYLGICMGAYWASPLYYDVMPNVRIVQNIQRRKASTRRSYGTVVPVMWQGNLEHMYFYDGCSILGDFKDNEVIALYENGDPAAVIRDSVGVIGPHPESDIYWYTTKKIQPYWHHYRHHQLLLDFVRTLLGN
jgi:glutamine amidotransferase-like uncharacterized protein